MNWDESWNPDLRAANCASGNCLSGSDVMWLLEQWNDIKGHFKWAVVLLILGIMVPGAMALTHGLALWQQLTLATMFVAMFGWAVFISAAYIVAARRGNFRNTSESPPKQQEAYPLSSLDSARIADTKQQLSCLSHFERFALWQLLLKGGLTGSQFADLARSYGVPVGTQLDVDKIGEIFSVIQDKSALLVCDETSERWAIKPEFKDLVHYWIERMSPLFGI